MPTRSGSGLSGFVETREPMLKRSKIYTIRRCDIGLGTFAHFVGIYRTPPDFCCCYTHVMEYRSSKEAFQSLNALKKKQWEFSIQVEGVQRDGHWQKARGIITGKWWSNKKVDLIEYGDRYLFSGLLKKNLSARNIGTPSLSIDVHSENTYRLSGGHGSWIVSWGLRRRRVCANILAKGLESYPEHIGLLQALLLGYRNELPRYLHEKFAATGTMHIFAISGLHVGIMAILFMAVFKAAGVSRYQWVLYLAPILIFYVLLTGMKASAIRACVMALVYWSAYLFKRRSDAYSSLALAAVFIILVSPKELIAPGFIFSFVVVTGLLFLYRPLT